ncbi:MAG: PPC domain-containing protein [Deltaproteobacteria bacterium]|nr:PPC domain-containing protein [Deltaproteobacteria bacterium]
MAAIALAWLAAEPGCVCGPSPTEPEKSCRLSSDCPPGQECDPERKVCVPAFSRYCDTDADCAVYGEDFYCQVDQHLCVSHHECGDGDPCPNDMVCETDPATGYRVCVYPGCDNHAECEAELAGQCGPGTRPRCVARACICQDACGGPCGDGRVCCANTPTPTCIDAPAHCASLVCSPGFVGTTPVESPWSVDDCAYTGDQCSCQERPPLPVGDIGEASALALLADGTPLVAGYNYGFDHDPDYPDTVYGDLMLGRATSSSTFEWRSVDGVPTSPIVAGPSGPRGGVIEPGDDMGRQLDLAVDASGRAHLAYWDRTHQALRYARVASDGSITVITVDSSGDAGRFPSIALDRDSGAPRIAAFTKRVTSAGGRYARLRVAVATTASPSTSSQFVLHTAASIDLTDVPCEGSCPPGEVCRDVADPGIDYCVTEGTTCGNCAEGRGCVGGICVPVVARPLVELTPPGIGLHARIGSRAGGGLLVLAHDSVAGDLVLLTPSAGANLLQPGASFVLRRLDGTDGRNVGTHVDLAMGSDGSAHLVYVDESLRSILYGRLSSGNVYSGGEVVDDGLRIGPLGTMDDHVVSDPAIALFGDGRRVVVFQDATVHSLWRCDGPVGGDFDRCGWLMGGEPGRYYRGSFGFSNDVAIDTTRNTAVISTYKFEPHLDAAYGNGVLLLDYPLAAQCREDVYEENDSQSAARTVEPMPMPGRICSGDDDWFSVALRAGQTVRVRLQLAHSNGDIDIALHSPSGAVMRTSARVSDLEEIKEEAATTGTYGVRVYGYRSAANNYTLAVDVE